jgi:hypothetical protein
MPPEHYKNWKNPSPGQLIQQNRFKAILPLLQLFLASIRIGFGLECKSKKITAFNYAMGYNKKNAVPANAPYNLIWANILFSKGTLLSADIDSHSSSKTTQQVGLTWIDNSGQGNALGTDKLFAMIYNKTTNVAVQFTPSTATRADGTVNLICPSGFMSTGDIIEIYSFFRSADNKLISTSLYWGEDTIA